MKILNKKLVEEASNNYESDSDIFVTEESFKAGVEWAESQMEELAIKFADWILNKNNPGFNITTKVIRSKKALRSEIPIWGSTRLGYGNTWSSKELFKQFLKERDEGQI